MTACLSETFPGAPPPCTVLIVDDDELVLEMLTLFLEFAGYTVATADGAYQALRVLEKTRCEVVIADWDMPDTTGPSLCRLIREQQLDPYIYVLLFTIRANSEDVINGLQAGADDYIVKGAPMGELLARLESGRRILSRSVNRTPEPFSPPPNMAAAPRRAETTPTPQAVDPAIALAREYRECRARNAPLSVLLCALDNIAGLDTSAGIALRAAILTALRAEIPKYLLESEWVAPRGCEGLMVVLPDAEPRVARLLAEKIRWAASVVGSGPLGDLNPFTVTVSIGIASTQAESDSNSLTPVDLLRSCEQCLAESRRQGGNRITATRAPWPP